ncbi:M23 family metallopeptidase [Devosia sp.]|uniref:M23 family metallopeptidase n=2 Tax=Devosia sp. TaxID=1871048 RepID=UPI0025C2A9D9|nr:M23 family metallopeptidase [Devosia sp.]
MRSFGLSDAKVAAFVHHGGISRKGGAKALRLSGWIDEPALTLNSTQGDHPHGRELSFAWLTGTVMTGLTSVLLMGAALYVSFEGQDTFSTAYEALQLINGKTDDSSSQQGTKGDRRRPVTQTRSDYELVDASIRELTGDRSLIRKQSFVRIRATLATTATALTADVPEYDPVAMLEADDQPSEQAPVANPEIYAANIEGEVSIRTSVLPSGFVPSPAITDANAAQFSKETVENLFAEGGGEGLLMAAYAPAPSGVRDLGVVDAGLSGVAENVTILAKTSARDNHLGRSERIVAMREGGALRDTLLKNGFDERTYPMLAASLANVIPSELMPRNARLRILMGPSRMSDTLIPYRLSIYFADEANGAIRHAATAALTDRGSYVLGLPPPDIAFPEEDTEQVNVNNLPTIYRAIWETARKHDVDDAITRRVVAMFAYDVDLSKRISAGDSIEILQTAPDGSGRSELLYVALKTGSTSRELYRFRTDEGSVDFYDPEGETGKRFLTRRPVKGGGRLVSRFGYRVHPIFKTRKLHTGSDFAAPLGTPIYAAGDGVVERAQWVSGYGKYVQLKHVNGIETAYGHMSRIADGLEPGMPVRQGQIIGYVGSTGNSTGNHLHYEIRVNGRPVDPLSVKLPRDKALPPQYEASFTQTVTQVRELMQRPAIPALVVAQR